MDLNGVERCVHALGGTDTITVNDLTGTDLPLGGVKVDLAGMRRRASPMARSTRDGQRRRR